MLANRSFSMWSYGFKWTRATSDTGPCSSLPSVYQSGLDHDFAGARIYLLRIKINDALSYDRFWPWTIVSKSRSRAMARYTKLTAKSAFSLAVIKNRYDCSGTILTKYETPDPPPLNKQLLTIQILR